MRVRVSPLLALSLVATGCLAGALSMSDADASFTGPDEERFGFVARGIGDVSGDGNPDFVVTSPIAGVDRVYVFFGPVGSGAFTSADADATFTGAANSETGWAVAAGGDLTGDGVNDLVIGAPSASSARGVVYVLAGPIRSQAYTTANAWATYSGYSANDILGTSLAVGDYSGDGRADLAVGAPWANVGRSADAGRVYLVRGPLRSGSRSITSVASYTFSGAAANALTGWSVAFGGDMDGTGGDELVIGAPRRDNGGTSAAGAAYVVWSGLAAGSHSLENAALAIGVLRGDRQAGELGYTLAGGGDVNDDGYDDVLVGAPSHYCVYHEDYGLAGACASDHGTVHLVGGEPRTAGVPALDGEFDITSIDFFTVNGTGAWGGLGESLAIVPDTDGDGADEMLVGSLQNPAFLFYGGPWTGEEVDDTQGHAILTGNAATDYAGVGVGSAGDVNGDGYGDLLVGAPAQKLYEDGPQPVDGKAYLFYGSP